MNIEKLKEIVSRVHFPGYTFEAYTRGCDANGPIYAVRVTYDEKDVQSGVQEQQQGRGWLIESNWCEEQVVQTCLKALLTSLEHRAREHFTWTPATPKPGHSVYQPHHSLPDLYAVSESPIADPIPFEDKGA